MKYSETKLGQLVCEPGFDVNGDDFIKLGIIYFKDDKFDAPFESTNIPAPIWVYWFNQGIRQDFEDFYSDELDNIGFIDDD